MRSLIHQLLTGSAPLEDLVKDRIYASSSLGIADLPQAPEKPFLTFRGLEVVPYREVSETANSAAQIFQVTAYDELGSYVRIERLLVLVRDALLTAVGVQSPSGVRCIDVEWRGNSGDLVSDQYNAAIKFSTYRFTGNQ